MEIALWLCLNTGSPEYQVHTADINQLVRFETVPVYYAEFRCTLFR